MISQGTEEKHSRISGRIMSTPDNGNIKVKVGSTKFNCVMKNEMSRKFDLDSLGLVKEVWKSIRKLNR